MRWGLCMICEQCLMASEALAIVDLGVGPWAYWCNNCRSNAFNFWQETAQLTLTPAGKAMALSESLRFRSER